MTDPVKKHTDIETRLKEKIAKIEEIIHSNERNAVKVKLINGILGKITDEFVGIHYKSLTDELTGFVNRWFLNEFLKKEIRSTRRYKREMSLAVLDIDFLKYINDNFGHKAGDKAIVKVSEAIKESIRSADVVARYGGDEFIIVFPSTSVKKAARVAQRIKAAVLKIRTAEGFQISVSIGLSELAKDHRLAEDLIEAADKELYKEKEHRVNLNLVKPE